MLCMGDGPSGPGGRRTGRVSPTDNDGTNKTTSDSYSYSLLLSSDCEALLGIAVHPDPMTRVSSHPQCAEEESWQSDRKGRRGDSRNIHCSQFLEQEFGGIGDIDLRDLRRVTAD